MNNTSRLLGIVTLLLLLVGAAFSDTVSNTVLISSHRYGRNVEVSRAKKTILELISPLISGSPTDWTFTKDGRLHIIVYRDRKALDLGVEVKLSELEFLAQDTIQIIDYDKVPETLKSQRDSIYSIFEESGRIDVQGLENLALYRSNYLKWGEARGGKPSEENKKSILRQEMYTMVAKFSQQRILKDLQTQKKGLQSQIDSIEALERTISEQDAAPQIRPR